MFYIFAELDIIMKTILIAGIHRTQGSFFFFFLYSDLLLITYKKKKKYLAFLFVPRKAPISKRQ